MFSSPSLVMFPLILYFLHTSNQVTQTETVKAEGRPLFSATLFGSGEFNRKYANLAISSFCTNAKENTYRKVCGQYNYYKLPQSQRHNQVQNDQSAQKIKTVTLFIWTGQNIVQNLKIQLDYGLFTKLKTGRPNRVGLFLFFTRK